VDEVIRKWENTRLGEKNLHAALLEEAFGTKAKQWPMRALGDIARVERGMFSHRPRNLPEFYGGEYPFVQTGDVHGADRVIRRFEYSLTDLGTTYSKSFPVGTIFVTIAAVIGATAISDREVYATDSVVGVVPGDGIDTHFLELCLRQKRHYLENQAATQTAQKNINLQVLRPLLVPCPDLKEQQRMAAKIIEPFDAARQASKHIEATQNLLSALANQFASSAP
jgi:type I restriction enzyme S subunit